MTEKFWEKYFKQEKQTTLKEEQHIWQVDKKVVKLELIILSIFTFY